MQNDYKETAFRNALKKRNLKYTKVRKSMFNALLFAKKPLSPTDIKKQLPEFDTSSIYRTLDSLLSAKIIHAVPRGFKTFYELSEIFIDHHHHVVCEKCGRVKVLANSQLEKLIKELTSQAGMEPTSHHIELNGICLECLNSKEKLS